MLSSATARKRAVGLPEGSAGRVERQRNSFPSREAGVSGCRRSSPMPTYVRKPTGLRCHQLSPQWRSSSLGSPAGLADFPNREGRKILPLDAGPSIRPAGGFSTSNTRMPKNLADILSCPCAVRVKCGRGMLSSRGGRWCGDQRFARTMNAPKASSCWAITLRVGSSFSANVFSSNFVCAEPTKTSGVPNTQALRYVKAMRR